VGRVGVPGVEAGTGANADRQAVAGGDGDIRTEVPGGATVVQR
jgi:hypothetical protein